MNSQRNNNKPLRPPLSGASILPGRPAPFVKPNKPGTAEDKSVAIAKRIAFDSRNLAPSSARRFFFDGFVKPIAMCKAMMDAESNDEAIRREWQARLILCTQLSKIGAHALTPEVVDRILDRAERRQAALDAGMPKDIVRGMFPETIVELIGGRDGK